MRHAFGAVPEQGRDRTEKQADDRRGDDRAQTDAALRGREIGFDRGRETISLARFLTERLDDFHRPHLFGGGRADVGDAILTGPRDFLKPPAEQHDRQDDHRDAEKDARGEFRREAEQIDDAADAHHHVPQRDRYGCPDHLLDDRGIRRHARGNFGRAVFFEEAGREAQQVALHRLADVGDGTLAEPADEIEAQRGSHGERNDDRVEEAEMRRNVTAAGDKAAVDHFLELIRDCERR